MSEAFKLDIEGILAQMPHRYPFLMIDRVTECVPGSHVIALKNVTINEPFFPGHFPGNPVMPGVLIVEAMAQATGILAYATVQRSAADEVYYLAGVDNARFKRPVVPGDQLVLHGRLERQLRGVWRFAVHAEVDGQLVARADMLAARGRQS
jgi:3-hydroxyacyl-[acyl-carrier-protein] dehydratase